MKPTFTTVQQQAIGHRRGVLMVQAAAGSGKTTVLSERCASLIADSPNPADISELLVLTFTRQAANQMRSGIAKALRSRVGGRTADRRLWQQAALVDQAHICTFDAFCAWLVRSCFAQTGQDPGFGVMDAVESRLLFRDCFRRTLRVWLMRNDEEAIAFADIFDHYADSSIAGLEQLLKPLESTLINLPDPETWARVALQQSGGMAQVVACYLPRLNALLEPLAAALENAHFQADPNKTMAQALTDAHAAVLHAVKTIQSDRPETWDNALAHISAVSFPDERWRFKTSFNDHPQATAFRRGPYALLKDEFTELAGNLSSLNSRQIANDEQESRRVAGILLNFHQACHREFTQAKAASGNLDFADITHLALAALKPPGPAEPSNPLPDLIHQRFKHILVDEYQDINPVQQELLRRLTPLIGQSRANPAPASPAAESFFGVGDVHQSIYAFRGSEPAIMDEQCQTVGGLPMPDNFRTLPPLVDALNAIFDAIFHHNRDPAAGPSPVQSGPLLKAGRPGAADSDSHTLIGAPVTLHVITKVPRNADAVQAGANAQTPSTNTEDEPSPVEADPSEASPEDPLAELDTMQMEACLIAAKIKEIIGASRTIPGKGEPGRRVEFSDIVILMRSVWSTAPILVRTLQDCGIPAFAELRTGFFDSQEVMETLELLNVLDNPAQDIPIASVLLGSFGGFTHDDLLKIRTAFPDRHAVPFYQAVVQFSQCSATVNAAPQANARPADSDLADRLNALLQRLENWRNQIHSLGVATGMARIFQDVNLFSRVLAKPYGHRRVANLKLLHQKAVQFGGRHARGLARFNAFVQNVRDDRDTDFGDAPLGDINAVRVMSVHASKGLEFPVVFVAGLGRKFKLQNSTCKLLASPNAGIGLKLFDPQSQDFHATIGHQIIMQNTRNRELAEEARILYVAMTRARDHLVLVGHASRKQLENWDKFNAMEGNKRTQNPLDWLGPIFSQSQNVVPPQPGILERIVHDSATLRIPSAIAPPRAAPADADLPLHRMLAFEPLASDQNSSAGDAVTFALKLATQPYRHLVQTQLPAVRTVSQLKSRVRENAIDSDDPTALLDELTGTDPPTEPAKLPEKSLPGYQEIEGSTAAAVGSVTHRVLELMDFSIAPTHQAVREQILTMIHAGRLTEAEATRVDIDPLAWFLTTPTGRRLAKATGQKGKLFRELTFFWTRPPDEMLQQPAAHGTAFGNPTMEEPISPADRVLVRGAMDALVIDEQGILLIDYKTDAINNIAQRRAMYQVQVRLYACAVREILNLPEATSMDGMLVFLQARNCENVSLEPGRYPPRK